MTQHAEAPASNTRLADELYRKHERSIFEHTDRLFAGLMMVQWVAGIAAAYWITPLTWAGTTSNTHLHVWAAIYLGGLVTLVPVVLALTRPGRTSTRYVIAIAQVLWSTLLIHFTGGRIETHFHVFASLVFLSFYRDWRVLVPATAIVAVDHFVRGVFWPESVFGILTASPWRWLEHAGWVIFEDVFLISSCIRSRAEMRSIAERTAASLMSEERYRAIVERAEGIFLADAGTKRLTECNVALQTLLGYAADEATHVTMYDVDVAPAPDVDAMIGRLKGAQRALDLERQFRCKDGTIIDVTLNLSALGSGDTICGAVRDVTEHRRAEAELKRSEEKLRHAYKMEAVGQLAGGIAHDFNNLLTAILGYAEVVVEELGEDHPVREDAAEIARAGETAASLTRQLLAFSRRQVLQPSVLDLNTVLSNVERMLRRLIGEHITLDLRLAPELRRIEADPGQLEQVILNLVVNARDAMRQGGRLTIETKNIDIHTTLPDGVRAGDGVVLVVTDTGCGMDASVQEHLFEPFFTTKEQGKGTGLGLSTVYGIVKQSGGAVAVESAPGRGSTFTVTLPAIVAPAKAAESKSAAPAPGGASETVLLVEDEPSVRSLARRALQRAGYTVLDAPHPEEAIRLMAGHTGRLDLILTDVVMPGMSGRALAELLVVSRPATKVLFMSGYADDALIPHGVASGEMALLPKPFTPSTLLQRVKEVLTSQQAPLTHHAA